MSKLREPCYGVSRRPKATIFLRPAKSPDARVVGECGAPLPGKELTCWHGAARIKPVSAKGKMKRERERERDNSANKTAAKEVVATSACST